MVSLIFLRSLLFTLALAAALIGGNAAAQGLPPPFAEELERAEIPHESVGLLVQDVTAATPLVSFNADKPFHPASTMKLVTAYAALELLGPAYVWKTTAYATGEQAGDVLSGDLVIKGSGDPKLVLENMWLFLRQIRAAGIREIRGDLVLDRSLFQEIWRDPSAFDGEPLKPYNASPDALLLNYKSLRVRFSPDEAGKIIKVALDPMLADYAVAGPVPATAKCGKWKNGLTVRFEDGGAHVDGEYAIDCGEQVWLLHPYQMSDTRFFGSVFRQLWRELGGKFDGNVRNGRLPLGARPIAEWTSPPLAEVIRDVNKFSNNVMARQLLLTLAALTFNQPATSERGALAVKNWLAAKGIPVDGMVIDNGSGLSRDERVTAATMGRLLAAAFAAPVMPEMLSSLPVAGVDGTMKQRLKEVGVFGRAHIKTGAVKDVRAIAGYVLAASGRRYLVVSMINHPNADRSRAAQDALLAWIHDGG